MIVIKKMRNIEKKKNSKSTISTTAERRGRSPSNDSDKDDKKHREKRNSKSSTTATERRGRSPSKDSDKGDRKHREKRNTKSSTTTTERRGRSPSKDSDKGDRKHREKKNPKNKRSPSSSSSSADDRTKKRASSRENRRRSKSPRRSDRSVSRDRDHRRRRRSSTPRRKERRRNRSSSERRRNRSPSPPSRRRSRRSPSSSTSSSESRRTSKRDKDTTAAPRRSRFTDKPNPPATPAPIPVPTLGAPSLLMGNLPSHHPMLSIGGGGYGLAQPVLNPAVPSVSPALAALLSGAMAAPQSIAPKEAKELFIGNTPPGTADAVLLEFLNAAMRQVGLLTGPLDPIATCRMNQKFAFIECRTIEDCSNCLNLDGIPFMGSMLKIGRPSKYTGPITPSVTWQQLTGQSVDSSGKTVDQSTKKFRELFVGNTSPEMTEVAMREFIGGAMHKMGLTYAPDNPIIQVRLNGRFAFLEFRTMEETANCLNLNGIPFLGQPLKISRPTKYEGPQIPYYEWDDLLARWLTGELKLTTAGPVSCALKLINMVNAATLADKTARDEVVEDTREECAGFGTVKRVLIPRVEDGSYAQQGVGKVYVEMSSEEEAKQALLALKGRTFDGRVVDVKFFPAVQLASDPPDFSDQKPLVITAVGPLPLESIIGAHALALGLGTGVGAGNPMGTAAGMGMSFMSNMTSMLQLPPPPTPTPTVMDTSYNALFQQNPPAPQQPDFDNLDGGNFLSMNRR